ncbi:MAG: hypothetical protein JWM11_4423 [Planctomycetaceae bacterium]|nr:hypothetical protein [Planctomycetaceae bacterium]
MPRCENCNNRVSADEETCPSCGEQMATRPAQRKSPKGKKPSKPKPAEEPNLWLAGGITGGVVILAAVVLMIFLLSRTPEPKPEVVVQKVEPIVPEKAPPPAPVVAQAPPQEDSNLRGIEERIRSQANLQQLGLAVHIFSDTFGQLPPETNSNKPDPALQMSWMTSLLPYVDQTAVFQSISRDEAWNAPINQQAIKTVIPVFLHKPGVDERDANGFGTANYAGNLHVFGTGKPFKMVNFVDGTSHTFIAGTVATGYRAWADPGNVRDIKNGLNGSTTGFGMPKQDRTILLMADGSVREVSNSISPQVLEGISLPADGKVNTSGF